MMRLLLLCLGLLLVCAHEEESSDAVRKSNFHDSEVASVIEGYWYSILLASDNKEKIEENGSMLVFVEKIEVNSTTMTFKYQAKDNGKCVGFSLSCDKTEKNGEYTVEYDGYNIFWIVEAKYDEYIIFHLNNFHNNATFSTMELYGRKPDVNDKLKRHFKKLCRKFGVNQNIIDLTKGDRCLKTRENEVPETSSAE